MNIPTALTPTRLRIILSTSLALIVLAGAGIFYLAYNKLGDTAAETGASAAQARESQDTLQRLQLLKRELEEKKDIVARASNVMANSQNYAYQDLLVRDLTVYANRADLTIKNISFSGQGTPATDGAAAPATGPRTATVDITLDTPVDYRNLLNFLHYVEQNLTKLKVGRVSMTKSDSNGVMIDALNLEVYVR